ncbi:MAG: hypothetical protein H0W65_03340 [Sphingomonas sp.]|uniref:hypothetical protein n=1 Tax=Sphingomonas sp. TaxID=28214 RepID=UPI0017D38FF3|nr:hypothetical protein [Sphingomonas sp.]MBA3666742.1 hypothetical protein [Sphingomonas sp.]
MASPFQTRKKAVDLAAPVSRGSRIRRDPPPPVKEIAPGEIEERDAQTIVIGIVTFALAFVIILFGFGQAAGWSPSQYTIEIRRSS